MASGGEKLIKDIRFFERSDEDVVGNPMPSYVGRLYPVIDRFEAALVGERYALKLAEHGFRTRGYHHVYVTLSPFLPEGEARVGNRHFESWCLFVDVGLPPEKWPADSADAQHACLLRAATRALEHLCDVHDLDGTVIRDTEAEVLAQGAGLEITRLFKETASYTLRVSYKVVRLGRPAPVYLEFREAASGRSGKIELMQVKSFDDVFPLFASATVSRGSITIRPRESFRAELTTREYQTPFQVPIARVLDGEE